MSGSLGVYNYLSIYIGYGQRRSNGEPLHWMIMYAPEGETQRCTWVHVTGGPREGYQLQIQAGKRFNSFGISKKELVGKIKISDEKKLKDAAKAIPMQRCQRWTTAFVARLEQKGLLPPGTAAQLERQIEPAPYDPQRNTGGSAGSGSRSGSSGSRAGGSKSGSQSSGFGNGVSTGQTGADLHGI